MKRFFKLFFYTGVPSGILMGYFYHSFSQGLTFGLFFGFFCTLCFRIMETIALKKIGKRDSDFSVRQERKFEVTMLKQDAIRKIKLVLDEMKAKILNDDSSNGIIEAKAGFSWKSFGEIIIVRFSGNNGKMEIFVESRPALATTMVDYGKNLQNVEKFQELMCSLKNH